MSIINEVKSIIDLENYKDDHLMKSYIEFLEEYKKLIKKGMASPPKRVLPSISEKMLLRQKFEFNRNTKRYNTE